MVEVDGSSPLPPTDNKTTGGDREIEAKCGDEKEICTLRCAFGKRLACIKMASRRGLLPKN